MASGYIYENKIKTIVVIVNYEQNTIPVTLNLQDISGSDDLKIYLADGKVGNDLAYKGTHSICDTFDMPTRCVETFRNQD